MVTNGEPSPLGCDTGPGWWARLFCLGWNFFALAKNSLAFYPWPVLPPGDDGFRRLKFQRILRNLAEISTRLDKCVIWRVARYVGGFVILPPNDFKSDSKVFQICHQGAVTVLVISTAFYRQDQSHFYVQHPCHGPSVTKLSNTSPFGWYYNKGVHLCASI